MDLKGSERSCRDAKWYTINQTEGCSFRLPKTRSTHYQGSDQLSDTRRPDFTTFRHVGWNTRRWQPSWSLCSDIPREPGWQYCPRYVAIHLQRRHCRYCWLRKYRLRQHLEIPRGVGTLSPRFEVQSRCRICGSLASGSAKTSLPASQRLFRLGSILSKNALLRLIVPLTDRIWFPLDPTSRIALCPKKCRSRNRFLLSTMALMLKILFRQYRSRAAHHGTSRHVKILVRFIAVGTVIADRPPGHGRRSPAPRCGPIHGIEAKPIPGMPPSGLYTGR